MKRKGPLISIFIWCLLPVLVFAGLESATYISQLSSANPTGTDHYSTADDHLRLIKGTILNTFPNISGAVTPTHTELNTLDGVNATLTPAELNVLDGLTGTIWTSTNDGNASALDASLLDGMDSSAFAEIANTETISSVWTYNAIPAFNGGTSGVSAPFSVDSNRLVTNLNADTVRGVRMVSAWITTSSGGCAINGGTSGFTCSRPLEGFWELTFSPAWTSSTSYVCTSTLSGDNGHNASSMQTSLQTASTTRGFYNTAGAGGFDDATFMIICVGT